jgi:Flp pilus assembly protein CpaB
VVIAVPTDSKLISNRLIRPGDHIDMVATFEVEITRHDNKNSPMPVSIALLQDLEIHAIILPTVTSDEDPTNAATSQNEGGVFRTADESGQSVLLAVNPQDAVAIRHILDVGGAIDLGLRPKNDETQTETTPVDQFSLAEEYGIDLNRN